MDDDHDDDDGMKVCMYACISIWNFNISQLLISTAQLHPLTIAICMKQFKVVLGYGTNKLNMHISNICKCDSS